MDVLKFDAFNKHIKFITEGNGQQASDKNLLQKEAMSDVSRCVSMILSRYPFFGEYIIDCRFLYDHPDVPTMATDGHNIYISSKFASTLSDSQMMFILCHEVLHTMMLHHLREFNKFGGFPTKEQHDAMNYAEDLEINPLLVRDGLATAEEVKDPKKLNGLYEDKYVGMACEVIYDMIQKDAKQQLPPGADYPVNIGDIIVDKNGEFGKITQITASGTFEIEELTKEEAYKILRK